MIVLDYAASLPWYRRRLIRRCATGLLALGLALGAIYFVGPRVYRRTMLLYWQHRCLIYTDAPGTVAMDVSATAQGAFVPAATGKPWPSQHEALDERLQDADLRYSLERIVLGFGTIDDYGVFMHGRRSPVGEQLVVVSAHSDSRGIHSLDDYHAGLTTRVIHSSGLFSDPKTRIATGANLPLKIAHSDSLRVYTGQPDPADDSAFTVDFEINSVRHTARFALAPTGDTINLISVTPPLP